MDDLEFDDLMDIARGAIDKASRNFGADDTETDRFAAFGVICLSEAARRIVIRSVKNPATLFEGYVDFWKAMQAGESPTPPPSPFRVIVGGKE